MIYLEGIFVIVLTDLLSMFITTLYEGGQLFIHYPVTNEAGAYNIDQKLLLQRALDEYRKRGLNIKGLSMSQDEVFYNITELKGLGLPFLFITEPNKKIDKSLDLYEITTEMNNYIIISSSSIDKFDIFSYIRSVKLIRPSAIYISANEDDKKLNYFLKEIYSLRISFRDFIIENYEHELIKFNNSKGKVETVSQKDKSEIEQFYEEEMKKIKGENLKPEKKSKEFYDISTFSSISIKLAIFIAFIFIIQVLIGKRFDVKKFFKSGS